MERERESPNPHSPSRLTVYRLIIGVVLNILAGSSSPPRLLHLSSLRGSRTHPLPIPPASRRIQSMEQQPAAAEPEVPAGLGLTAAEYAQLQPTVEEHHRYDLGAGQCSSLVAQRIEAPQVYKHFIRSCALRPDPDAGDAPPAPPPRAVWERGTRGRGRRRAGGGGEGRRRNGPGGATGEGFSSARTALPARTRASEKRIPSQYRGVELCIREPFSWSRGWVSSELVSNSTNQYHTHPNAGIQIFNSKNPIQSSILCNQTRGKGSSVSWLDRIHG